MPSFTHQRLLRSSQRALVDSSNILTTTRTLARRASIPVGPRVDRSEPFIRVGCQACGARGRLLTEELAEWAAVHPYRCT